MPLIEELPVTGPTRVSHGWAYIPDTGPIPAMVQPGSRKRNRNDAGTTNATATAKQQKAVQQRLESLDKENYKDGVTVPIPTRAGGRESKTNKKMTSNVRRILTYQRTFQHYLADEEAVTSGNTVNTSTSQAATQKTDIRRKSGIESTTTSSRRGGNTITNTTTQTPSTITVASAKSKTNIKTEHQTTTTTTPGTESTTPNKPLQPQSQSQSHSKPTSPTTTRTPFVRPPYDPSLDTHPLLRTLSLPKMPSDRVMQLLISEPPLTYSAARATYNNNNNNPGTAGGIGGSGNVGDNGMQREKPPRHFCALCGYWGKVKCRKCGEWTCGLMECWKGHEGVCVSLGMY